MKDKIFGVLQRVGRSFMLPIAVLPVAGLLLGIGSSFTNETTIATYGLQSILGNGTMLHALLVIISKAGNVIFDNLPDYFRCGCCHRYGKSREGSRSIVCYDIVFRYARIHQCSIGGIRENSGRWKHCRQCLRWDHRQCLWHSVFADGRIWRYYRRTWGSGPA